VTAAPDVRAKSVPEPESEPPRRGLRRGSLTKQIIVTESLRLLDTGGLEGFSMPKLGRALGADQTAVYRHFASKDDLILAIADRLIEEATAGLEPSPCWVDTLTDLARRQRATYLTHPAAASMSAYRTTQGPAEIAAVNVILGAVHAAGFEGAQAALMYRTVGDFALAFAGFEAAFLSLDAKAQQNDRAAWTQAYLSVDRAQFPAIWRVRTLLPEVKDDDIFENLLGLVMTGLLQSAPQPCDCHPRAGG
jgi:AcrR family transcriptional regulator